MRRAAGLLALLAASAAIAQPPPARQAELIALVRQDCGACHGLALKGGLGPALEPSALRDKDAQVLRYVILEGRRGTAMPPWRSFLTETEAAWVVERLKQGFPK